MRFCLFDKDTIRGVPERVAAELALLKETCRVSTNNLQIIECFHLMKDWISTSLDQIRFGER